MRFVTIVGARPQFIKAGPLSLALRRRNKEVLVHTGQHYDEGMSDVFFRELGLPAPDHHLGIGSGSHGAQTGTMLQAVEKVILREKPDAVVVYGDTNSTLAGALAAVKLHIPVAHVEAGLRSFDRSMPEEINRVVADQISTWLFAPSDASRRLLAKEGVTRGVHVVGDIMADAVRLHSCRALQRSHALKEHGLQPRGFYLATVHRAGNTDHRERLSGIFQAFGRLDKRVVLPLHPRTKKAMSRHAIRPGRNIVLTPPKGYLDMLRLQSAAACVLTDSGGMQKEAYYLRVPCVTLRDETEWVETLKTGWNTLAGADPARIMAAVQRRSPDGKKHPVLYGDGKAAERIARILCAA